MSCVDVSVGDWDFLCQLSRFIRFICQRSHFEREYTWSNLQNYWFAVGLSIFCQTCSLLGQCIYSTINCKPDTWKASRRTSGASRDTLSTFDLLLSIYPMSSQSHQKRRAISCFCLIRPTGRYFLEFLLNWDVMIDFTGKCLLYQGPWFLLPGFQKPLGSTLLKTARRIRFVWGAHGGDESSQRWAHDDRLCGDSLGSSLGSRDPVGGHGAKSKDKFSGGVLGEVFLVFSSVFS